MATTESEREQRRRRLRDPANVRFKYQPQFGVIVVCKSERKQRSIFNRLQKLALDCDELKVVVV